MGSRGLSTTRRRLKSETPPPALRRLLRSPGSGWNPLGAPYLRKMRSGFLDTLTRIVMMVLAGMVSLSIIGAIAAMSEGGGGPAGTVFVQKPQPAPVEAGETEAAPASGAGRGGLGRSGATGEAAAPAGAVAGPATDESAKWLEVIAYVLFALAGLFALLALILWRILADLRRAADAAERLAARNREC